MIQEQKNQFFANRPNTTTIKMGGRKLALVNLPKESQKGIMDRLAEKDEVLNKGSRGILPGLKIDGIQVTKDNIKDFELKPKAEKVKKEEEKVEVKKYTKKELNAMEFKDLKVIGKKFGTTDRSKDNLIKEILKYYKEE